MKALVAGMLSAVVLAGCGAVSGSGGLVGPRPESSAEASNSPGAWDPNPVPAPRWEECMQRYGQLQQEIVEASFSRMPPPRARDWPFEIVESTEMRGYGKISEATVLACGVVDEMEEWLNGGS